MNVFKKNLLPLEERTLYHGTVNDNLDSIQKLGLSGGLGDFVKDSYGMELDQEEWEEHLGDVTFAADKNSIDSAVGAMRYHVGKKLKKYLTDVDEEDLRQHGMLVIIRDIPDSKKIKYREDVEDGEWYNRPKNDQDPYGVYPMSVEPGDWFVKGGAGADDILTGNKMIQFLRRIDGLKDLTSDLRRTLIKYAVAYYGEQERERVTQKVIKLSDKEVKEYLRRYKDLGQENLNQKRDARYGGENQRQKSKQLSLDFGEWKPTRMRHVAENTQLKTLVEMIIEEVLLESKNVPTNPTLWSRSKSMAKQKFKVYPSAYANAWAARDYKSKGGKWRKKKKK